ncbi:MAG TPA: hypothetical protein VGS97_24980 [Actinocrinis sp.]|uniref:hypothetical protein n=1 Tax=Actinocrinis sp. TaxID=1920516 RepID=UPI002DDCA4EF|nr:hypothetical protein [Actinocrinis sp.]HEV2347373.1 hypothetical protein [Actinocrinis sp.]
MTGTLPPWSPLNDPQLSARIQAGLQDSREGARRDAQRDLYFLERYAWQEYPVKCGRWRRIDDPGALTSGTNMSGPWTKKTWTADFGWLLLIDPAGNRPIAAHKVDWPTQQQGNRMVSPVGAQTRSIWLAGDPRVGGMFSPVGDGHTAAFGNRADKNGLRRWEGPQHFEQSAAAVAAEPYREPGGGDLGPWLADQPQAPPDPKRFGATRG